MEDTKRTFLQKGALFHEKYEVGDLIDIGGMGAVYKAHDLTLDRPCALKTMRPSASSDPNLRKRFREEAKIAARIRSEHLVVVYQADVDSQTRLPFIAMELLEGADLATVLRERHRLGFAEVVELVRQIADTLDVLHENRVLHRDLKPENLFLTTSSDGKPCVKILDFGIAKRIETDFSPTTRSIGTPLYMPPEQYRGQPDFRTDLYALGHVAFTLLTGKAYWQLEYDENGDQAIREGQRRNAPEAASLRAGSVELPEGFDAWFAKATALEPSVRFDFGAELAASLADALGVPLTLPLPRGRVTTATADTLPSPHGAARDSTTAVSAASRAAPSRAPWQLVVAVVGAVAAVVLVVRLLWPSSARAPSADFVKASQQPTVSKKGKTNPETTVPPAPERVQPSTPEASPTPAPTPEAAAPAASKRQRPRLPKLPEDEPYLERQ